jgi:integrase
MPTSVSLALRVHGDCGPIIRALILFAGYTGMRPGERFGLEWDDIDFERMRVRISRRVYKGRTALPKNSKIRTVVLTPEAAVALGTGKRALLAFYELRHRAAQWMYVELGMHERLVAVQLGHTDGGKLVRELYGHGDHGALDEIDRHFASTGTARLRAV